MCAVVRTVEGAGLETLYHMLAYHLGWEGEGSGPEARGKRIRPLLTLLACASAGGEWPDCLPAAAAVELIHNFSLIHDDIEDNSPLRRGRPTIWKKWGVPQAINAGDTMFTLAFLALQRLNETAGPETAVLANQMLQAACLRLTQGQYLDMAYESAGELPLEAYWTMVGGKTAALLEACTGLGALVAGASEARQEAYRAFGRDLGLAFQVQDDLLGIWGDAALTGKSAESDLVSGKKSLPVLYGLSQQGEFASRWSDRRISTWEVASIAALLEAEGARAYAEQVANQLTARAIAALEDAEPKGEAGAALEELANRLLKRRA